jgi:hypothetical protein
VTENPSTPDLERLLSWVGFLEALSPEERRKLAQESNRSGSGVDGFSVTARMMAR